MGYMKLVFDMEGNGLREDCTRVWCIVTKDIDTSEIRQFKPHEIHEALEHLKRANMLIGHNIIGYDIPVFNKLYKWCTMGELFDTLVVSRLLNPDRKVPEGWSGQQKPHSVEAWGMRFGRAKPVNEDWSAYTDHMLHRCTEDVEITHMIYNELLKEMKK